MPARRPRQRPDPPPGGLLDWSDSRHWAQQARPCRYCDQPTNLRDSSRKPAHKTCAEDAIRQQIQDAAAAYENERLI
ncbi:hypothetical protein J7E96_28245 [Streptomyces sp. ISL-96]|uniref:hypothetical protein n=1 Tax=Streptomyces sp. ISL-96 TaxID=2819191 RepID=UPI001BE80F17|nr:hypothetical protein [Streptomyces sp. ISL-96]MBT2492331.1 hypothetical protein [Streptomyces sp. ISL-96]